MAESGRMIESCGGTSGWTRARGDQPRTEASARRTTYDPSLPTICTDKYFQVYVFRILNKATGIIPWLAYAFNNDEVINARRFTQELVQSSFNGEERALKELKRKEIEEKKERIKNAELRKEIEDLKLKAKQEAEVFAARRTREDEARQARGQTPPPTTIITEEVEGFGKEYENEQEQETITTPGANVEPTLTNGITSDMEQTVTIPNLTDGITSDMEQTVTIPNLTDGITSDIEQTITIPNVTDGITSDVTPTVTIPNVTDGITFDIEQTITIPNVTDGITSDFTPTVTIPNLTDGITSDFTPTVTIPNVTDGITSDFTPTVTIPNVTDGITSDMEPNGPIPNVTDVVTSDMEPNGQVSDSFNATTDTQACIINELEKSALLENVSSSDNDFESSRVNVFDDATIADLSNIVTDSLVLSGVLSKDDQTAINNSVEEETNGDGIEIPIMEPGTSQHDEQASLSDPDYSESTDEETDSDIDRPNEKRGKKELKPAKRFKKDGEKMDPLYELKNGKFECKVCGSKFKHRPTANRHIKTAHSQKSFECEICKRIFTRSDLYKNHLKTDLHRRKAEKKENGDKKE